MNIRIHRIPLGFTDCYAIQGEGIIMIDGGMSGKARSFLRAVERIPIRPEEIQLIVITHGHFDHIGSVKDIKEITGAKVVMHQLDKDFIEKSFQRLPAGVTAWGRISIKLLALFKPLIRIPTTAVDIILGDEGLSLTEYGIPGRVIHTPGHTPGSVTVLLDTGEAFVGDSAMNKFPLRLNPGLPILAEDFEKVKESWKQLLDLGARTVYPGHGRPFSAEVVRRALA